MKNVISLFVLFLIGINVQSQNNLEVGLSSSIIKFSDKSAAIIGDKHLFQTPTLNIAYKFNDTFSVNAEVSFSMIKSIGVISNSINYNSYGLSVRYHLGSFNRFKPYAFVGGTMVKAELKRTPTLNFGIGNSYWLTDRLAISTQIAYKFSENRFESMKSHFQFSGGIIYSFDIGHLFRRKSVCKTNGF